MLLVMVPAKSVASLSLAATMWISSSGAGRVSNPAFTVCGYLEREVRQFTCELPPVPASCSSQLQSPVPDSTRLSGSSAVMSGLSPFYYGGHLQ